MIRIGLMVLGTGLMLWAWRGAVLPLTGRNVLAAALRLAGADLGFALLAWEVDVVHPLSGLTRELAFGRSGARPFDRLVTWSGSDDPELAP